ncbi:MAG: sodium-dependent transporter [Clostridia bacterium]|nr:sodium-dependent transporter [Clostridia bacterium]
MSKSRGSFSSRLGFVLAAAGSAVGLGNIWRFPYLAARYGGGVFLLVYLALAVTFGFALMTMEIAIGRRTGQSAIGAFRTLHRKYTFLGYLVSAVPYFILPYYCVVGGWVAKYWVTSLSEGAELLAQGTFFEGFISRGGESLLWFGVFLGLTALVVLFGVEKGIEQLSKWLMPLLVVLNLVVVAYVLFLPGAGEGVFYYLRPDFSRFSVNTVLAAMGQLFYSMSLSMGTMITFGSYMKDDVDIHRSVRQIEWFDTGIAFLSGLMVVPAVFALSGAQGLDAGSGLMFVTLPQVFAGMAGGRLICALFFLLVLLAALTSSVAMMETAVSALQDRLHWSRAATCLMVVGATVALGLPSSLGNGLWAHIRPFGLSLLDFFDFVGNNILMPIVALLTCLFVGYVVGPRVLIDEARLKPREAVLFRTVIRYVAPVFIVLILVTSLLDALSISSF